MTGFRRDRREAPISVSWHHSGITARPAVAVTKTRRLYLLIDPKQFILAKMPFAIGAIERSIGNDPRHTFALHIARMKRGIGLPSLELLQRGDT